MDFPSIAAFISKPYVVILVALWLIYALYFWRRILQTRVRVLPKWLWILVIAFVSPPLSGIVFLTSGQAE
jgi:hypothetical protein